MSLNERQKEAVEYIEGPLLVLAGPGTGKTHLLSARVEHILKTTDTNPENVLCLTFTESGASNMRARLLTTIGPAARKIEIHTYHAFGTDLLGQYKNYAESFERRLDGSIDEVTQFKMVREIQDGLSATDILKSGSTKDIISTIASAKAARLTGADLVRVAEENMRVSEEISREVSPILAGGRKGARFQEAVETVYMPVLETLGKFCSAKPILKDIEPVANVLVRDLNRIINSEQEKEKPTVKALSSWRSACFEKDEKGEYRLKDRVANKKLRSLGKIMTAYGEKLEAEGLFDFSDMIEQAICILKEDAGFRATMTERFQYVLLDEFQDTNPSQAELIKLLTDYEKPNVMAVGDDDQAIFEFQGADASNLLNFQRYYGAKVVNLQENYRSCQEILDFSRRIADQISDSFAKNEGVQAMGLSKNLKAFKGAGAEIVRHEFLTSDAEYEFVAGEIERLIKNGVKQSEIAVITPKHKYIAPLLPFLKARGKINIAYEKKDNLLEDPRLAEILELARFIYDISQGKNVSSRLLQILSFPFLEIPPAEAIGAIYKAKEAHKAGLEYLLNSDSVRLREFGQFLAKLTTLSFDTPLELMLDYLVGTVAVDDYRCPFVEFYAKEQDSYETFELYENLAVLKEAILAHAAGVKNLRLKDLVGMVEDYEAAGASLTNTSPYRDSADAVQILTAHKSKGLEFEYVFLVAMDNLSWGKAKGNNNTLTLPKNMVQIRHTGVTDDERLRLLFVAITRAKRVLVLTNSLKDFAGKSPARLDYLAEYENGEGEVVSPYIYTGVAESGDRKDSEDGLEGDVKNGAGGLKVNLHYEDLSEARKEVDLRRSWRASYAKLTPELKPFLLARMENYRLNATDLTNFIDVSRHGPMDFYVRKVLKAPSEPLTEQMMFGILMHRAFERATKEKTTDEELIALYRKEAEECDLSAREVQNLLERGEQSLKISLAEFGTLLRAQNSQAEVDLASEHIMFTEVPVTGKIDHIEVDEKEKTLEVYDFKTAKYLDKKWGSDVSLLKYAIQLAFYKIMLNNSPRYKKYTVTRGHLLYVKPDVEGRVYDKVLEFDVGEGAEILKTVERLIPAAYKIMTELRFLDDSEIGVEADESLGIKDVKSFVAMLLEKGAPEMTI